MRNLKRFNGKMIATAAAGALALAMVFSVGATSVAGQDYMAPRTAFGAPDLNGIFQAIGSHHWNIEPHAASHGPVVELGAIFAVPGGLGIVEGGEIPYTAAARAIQQENAQHWVERDPNAKCYMPGIPRATYQPYPFQIVQTEEYILFAYEFASASRVVYMDRPDFEAPVDAWMGHSRGSFDGETLVIDVTAQMPDTWLEPQRQSPQQPDPRRRAVHRDQPVPPELRGDHRGSGDLHAALVDQPAAVPPDRREHAASRVQVRGVRRGADVRASAQGSRPDADLSPQRLRLGLRGRGARPAVGKASDGSTQVDEQFKNWR